MRKMILFFIIWFAGVVTLAKLVWPIIATIAEAPNLGAFFVIIVAVAWTLSCMGVALR